MKQEWYQSWFNSEYYHLLYRHRDCDEAEFFLDNLLARLQISPGSSILDLACGRGRHSIYLSKKGFDVTGIDLSQNNIAYAKKSENNKLSFFIHDMRKPFRINYFDTVMNIFTSFGYFEREKDNLDVLKSAASGLKPGGIFVLDFLNTGFLKKNIIKEETVKENGLVFHISRSFDNNWVTKKIDVADHGKKFHFEENVRAFSADDFQKFFSASRLEILNLFGDYSLNNFDSENSERLILIAKK